MDLIRELVKNGFGVWGKIKEDFKENQDAEAFLKKSHLVVMIDTHQLELDKATCLDKASGKKTADMTPEEQASEEKRKKLLTYYRRNARLITVEVRFPSVKIDIIQELKKHHLIKGLSSASPASIRLVLVMHEIKREKTHVSVD